MASLRLQVEARLAWEGGDKAGNHRGQQGQEGRIRVVFAARPGLAKRGLMREGTQRVDVGEEVVDQGVHGAEGTQGLGGELRGVRRLQLGQRMGGVGGRLRRGVGVGMGVGMGGGVGGGRVLVLVLQTALLDGFSMAVGRSSPPAGALKGTRYLQRRARPARRARLVALDLADAARVAGLAQAVRLAGLLRRRRLRGLERVHRRHGRRALVGQGMVCVERLRLQHLVDVLELGVRRLGRRWVGRSPRRLAVEQRRIGVLRVERRVGMRRVLVGRCWVRALRHDDGLREIRCLASGASGRDVSSQQCSSAGGLAATPGKDSQDGPAPATAGYGRLYGSTYSVLLVQSLAVCSSLQVLRFTCCVAQRNFCARTQMHAFGNSRLHGTLDRSAEQAPRLFYTTTYKSQHYDQTASSLCNC